MGGLLCPVMSLVLDGCLVCWPVRGVWFGCISLARGVGLIIIRLFAYWLLFVFVAG